MPEVRELPAGETARAARALLELRPQFSEPGLVERIDTVLRAGGYRLIGSFEPGERDAAGAAGFRLVEMLAWGRAIYVDDFVTLPEHRRRGHADALFAWLEEEASRLGCDQIHLDSGVFAERADAHRFYFRHGMRIAAYHFLKAARRA